MPAEVGERVMRTLAPRVRAGAAGLRPAMPVGDRRSSDAGRRVPVGLEIPGYLREPAATGSTVVVRTRSSAGDVGPVLDHLLPPAAVGGKQSLCRLPVRLQQVHESGVEILL